jgi:P27 family predicted phage terminase small subunit
MIRGTKPKPFDQIVASLLDKGKSPTEALANATTLLPRAVDGRLLPSARLEANRGALAYFEFYRDTSGFGHLQPIDGPLVERYCLFLDLFDQVVDEYLAGTLISTTTRGQETVSPYMITMEKLAGLIRKFASELGLTPVERARRGNPQNETNDKELADKRREVRDRYGLSQG